MEENIRGSYEETINLTSKRFVKMILVDASFILELLFKCSSKSLTSDDPMVAEPRANAVRLDLLLLENQLPFFVIEKLHDLAFPSNSYANPCLSNYGALLKLSFDYFRDVPCIQLRQVLQDHPIVKVDRFTDLLRTFQLPPPEQQPKDRLQLINQLYSATQLYEAGVKFKLGESPGCFDIKFEKGVLEIPHLALTDSTEVVIRNITALEQTYHIDEAYFIE